MSENDSMDLKIGDVDFNMNRHNTSLFTFLGGLATHNHLFLVHEQEESKAYGTYVFPINPHYNELAAFAVQHCFPAHTNLLKIAQCDLDAYDNALAREAAEADNGIPEGW